MPFENNIEKEKTRLLLLNILVIIKNIFEDAGIRYYIFAGTLLGALRYGGFIPWDDDIDMIIHREDYNKAICLLKEKLPNGLCITCNEFNTDYYQEYPKVCYLNSENTVSELAVDIFVLDKTNENDKILRWIQDKVVNGIYFIKRYKISKSKDNPWIPKKWYLKVILAILSVFKISFLNKVLLYVMTIRENKDTDSFTNWGSWFDYRTQIFKKETFGVATNGIFEGIEFPFPTDPHDFLVNNYGKDYMTPPPKEKQINHQISLVGCEDVNLEEIKQNILKNKVENFK